VNAPPIGGPTTDASAYVAERTLVAAGLYLGRTQKFITTKQPAKVPAAPAPVIARPAIKVLLFGAAAIKSDLRIYQFKRVDPTAQQTTNFKYQDTNEKNNFHGEILEALAPY
jgi:hypothetical protein